MVDTGNIGRSHYSGAISAARGMWIMNGLLLILLLWGVLLYGLPALGLVCLSVFSAVISETLILVTRPGRDGIRELSNGSAVLCGFLFGLSIPVTAHWLVAVIGPIFAIVIVKWGCGGLGRNWLNPALAGRLCVQLSWPEGFTAGDWGKSLLPEVGWNIDAVSAASDLTQIKAGLIGSGQVFRSLSLLEREFSPVDNFLVRFLNEQVLVHSGIVLPEGYVDYLLGFRYGAIGESSIVLILFISVFLFARRIISWQIPLGGFITMSILSFTFSGTFGGASFFSGDTLFALCSGGFLFTLMFMATDPVTSPHSGRGKLLFGLGFGALAFLLGEFSILPESSTLSLLLMNMLCPLIDSSMRKKPLTVTGAVNA